MPKMRQSLLAMFLFASMLFYVKGEMIAVAQDSAATQPTTDVAEPDESVDEMRNRAGEQWSQKHNFSEACKIYDSATKLFPKNVRLLVSMSATSIDFAYQNADTKEGKAAYKRARTAIDKGLKLIKDGDGEDIDSSAEHALSSMRKMLP